MAREHVTARLWDEAAGTLDPDSSAQVRAHLEQCEECARKLQDAIDARRMLSLSKAAPAPEVSWNRVTDAINARAHQEESHRSWRWPLALAATLGVIAVGIGIVRGPHVAPASAPPLAASEPARIEEPVRPALDQAPVPPAIAAPVTRLARLQRAKVVRSGAALAAPAELVDGDRIETDKIGTATVELADASTLHVTDVSTVVLTRVAADEVRLQLERGALGVQASHRERRSFEVLVGKVVVRVVGTVFTVEREAGGGVMVGVAEGRVEVAREGSAPVAVFAGERVRIGAGPGRAIALEEKEKRRVEALVSGAAVYALGRDWPRSSSRKQAPPVPPPPAVPEEAPAPAPAPEPQGSPVALAEPPLLEANVPLPSHDARAEEEEEPVSRRWTPEETEELLARAYRSIGEGHCGAFLPDLLEIVVQGPDAPRRARARVLRARCYGSRMQFLEAAEEYRLYLFANPSGSDAAEAMRGSQQ